MSRDTASTHFIFFLKQTDASLKKKIIEYKDAVNRYYLFTEGIPVCAFDYISTAYTPADGVYYYSSTIIQYYEKFNAYRISVIIADNGNTNTSPLLNSLLFAINVKSIVYYI